MATITIKKKSYNLNDKPVEEWNNPDFVRYYAQRLQELTGENILEDDSVSFAGPASRIKKFRAKFNINSRRYKEFVDYIFDNVFPNIEIDSNSFNMIISEKMYNNAMKNL